MKNKNKNKNVQFENKYQKNYLTAKLIVWIVQIGLEWVHSGHYVGIVYSIKFIY